MALVRRLQGFAARRVPVELVLDDNRVLDAHELSAREAADYVDPVSGVSRDALLQAMAGGQVNLMPSGVEKDDAAALPAAMVEFQQLQNYQPTVFHDMGTVNSIFSSSPKLPEHSQCHQRAMYWTRSWYNQRSVYSMKVMMFYTERYRKTFIRKHWYGDETYKWWYHTAPFVYFQDQDGNYQEIVLDRQFCDTPLTLDQWTHYFLAEEGPGWSNADYKPSLSMQDTHCRVMHSYAEYSSQNGYDWCMVRKFPMYYMQPNAIEALDWAGQGQTPANCQRAIHTGFTQWDIDHSQF
jgi:hypothetical protein